MRVVVTGATGFIGSHLVPALLDEGHEVVALVRRPGAVAPREGLAVQRVDLAGTLDARALGSFDAVIHLAQANVPIPDGARELLLVNTASTQQLLDAARAAGAERFVYTSSGSIYGPVEGPIAEDEPSRAKDFYAVTKQASEALVEAYSQFLTTVTLRPFTPYGPGQQGRLIPNLVERIRNAEPVMLNAGGRPSMSPIYVEDVVRVIVAALAADEPVVANVAGDEALTIRELAERIGAAVGREPLFTETGKTVAGSFVGDNARMRETFDVRELVPLDEGLRRVVESAALA